MNLAAKLEWRSILAIALLAAGATAAVPSTAFAQGEPRVLEEEPEDAVDDTVDADADAAEEEPLTNDTVEVEDDTDTTTNTVEETAPPAVAPASPAPDDRTSVPGTDTNDSLVAQSVDADTDAEGAFIPFFELTSRLSSYNNLDFRPIADPTAPFIDQYDSDDRAVFALTRVAGGFEYEPIEDLETALAVSHVGLWGNDDLGSTNAFGGVLYVERLQVEWDIVDTEAIEIETIVGRQRFEIGNFSSPEGSNFSFNSRDYLFDDVIDGVTLNFEMGAIGTIRLLPIDIYAVGARPDDINTAAPFGPENDTLFSMRFDGDVNTIRTGGIYENTSILDGLAFRAFGFYADIGAGGTGSDRSYQGATGNVVDNDYVWMAGARVNYALALTDSFGLGLGGEFARSGGIDRKPTQAGFRDVDTEGNAFGVNVIPALDLGTVQIGIPLGFFLADGSNYASEDGQKFTHGFVSFKGDQVGGLLANSALGWHPTAYVGNGVSANEHDKDRQSGTMVLSGGVEVDLFNDQLGLDVGFWYFQDTGSTFLDQAQLDRIADLPAFGYTRADLEAQERLGKALATELDVTVTYAPNDLLDLYVVGGVLLPGEFYETEIDRQAGTFIGSTEPVTGWGITGGLSLDI